MMYHEGTGPRVGRRAWQSSMHHECCPGPSWSVLL